LSTYITLPVLPELLESDFLSLTIKEEFLLEVFFVIRQKLLSTKVCEVEVVGVVVLSSEVVGVVEEPLSLLLQEMTVRLKRDMRIMYKTLFIFFLHQ
jgi:hypothetical protein